MNKRILLVARYYSIEPLGLLYLAGIVRSTAGWECKVILIKDFDFKPLYEEVDAWKPDLVGFQIWTGYHIPAFEACDRIRLLKVPVVIGGPHATYYHDECAKHADWVIKGSGFGLFRKLLAGMIPANQFGQSSSLGNGSSNIVYFDKGGREESFPMPDRNAVYREYPELGASPIKSIFASVGCPFFCTYCYAPSFNEMHGGFKLTVRPVDDVVTEALDILQKWPLKMVYFQDDIFGYNTTWLEEFTKKWKAQVKIPFHCQIRLELANNASGDRRLDMFKEAGCSGITLAIESGNAFLRDHVLFRHMPADLLEEGCRKILSRGMTLRTEQILAVPFSDIATDLATLGLNGRINPTMAWTSILAPYGGTDMGTIAVNFGLYDGNNDGLAESFFDRSVLTHVVGGPQGIESIVSKCNVGPKSRVLLEMRALKRGRGAAIMYSGKAVGEIEYLDIAANNHYCNKTVRLQRHFIPLAKMPDAEKLGARLLQVSAVNWSWKGMEYVIEEHLQHAGYSPNILDGWKHELAVQMGLSSAKQLPTLIADNPLYFVFFPEGALLAQKCIQQGILEGEDFLKVQDMLGPVARRHLFHYGLYKIERGMEPIAHS